MTSGPGGAGSGGSAESTTDLAVTRTVLAARRTLMAWVRTALSMISFGFTIYKFLRGLDDAGAIHLRRPNEPRNVGLFLVALGTGSLIAGMFEHAHTLARATGRRSGFGAAFYLACGVVLLGIIVLVGLVGHRGPF